MEEHATSTIEPDIRPDVSGSLFSAFETQIVRPRLSFSYQFALSLVAAAVMVLPILYFGIVALTGYGVFLLARKDTEVYAVALAVVGFFLIKPIFARRRKSAPTFALTPEEEPLLFEFIRRVSVSLGSPVPTRVEITCQANASARFRRGLLSFWKNDVVLTLGLPLAAALDTRDFAGLLAHELGHFSQRGGMRFIFLIETINDWFFRIVYERDTWDEHLVRWSLEARRLHLGLAVIFYAMRAGVWLTRCFFWVFVLLGRLVSGVMCRQMEFNADLYDVKLAGSPSLAAQLDTGELLNFADMKAHGLLPEIWRSKRLPANLPLFILRMAQSFTEEERLALRLALASQPGRWFDTHPPTTERIRRAELANEPGVFSSMQPAAVLFQDFESTAQSISARHYQEILGLELKTETLVDSDAISAEARLLSECDEAFDRYYQGCLTQLRPFMLREQQLQRLPDPNVSLANLNALRAEMKRTAAAATGVIDSYAEAYVHMRTARMALQMLEAGFVFSEKDFQTPGLTLMQSLHSRMQGIHRDQPLVMTLAEFETTAQARLAAALQLLPVPEVAERVGDSTLGPEAFQLIKVLNQVGTIVPCLQELDHCAVTLSMLVGKRSTGPNAAKIEQAILSVANGARANLSEVHARLAELPYPFPHVRPNLSVMEYVQFEIPNGTAIDALDLQCRVHVDQLFALNKRIMGRLAMIAEKIERQVIAD